MLFSIQSFWENHFLLPGAVHKQIQQLFTRFLWSGDVQKKGGAKVAWERVCLPIEEGGLGIKNLKEWNTTQILFHLCKVVSKVNSLWARWVWSTALRNNNFWTMAIPTDYSWIWKRVLKLRPLARQFLVFKIWNGQGTSLWVGKSLPCSWYL